MSSTLATRNLGQSSGGAMPPPSQVQRMPEEQDRARDNKVSYSFCWSNESTVCVSVSNSLRRDLSVIFLLNFLVKN